MASVFPSIALPKKGLAFSVFWALGTWECVVPKFSDLQTHHFHFGPYSFNKRTNAASRGGYRILFARTSSRRSWWLERIQAALEGVAALKPHLCEELQRLEEEMLGVEFLDRYIQFYIYIYMVDMSDIKKVDLAGGGEHIYMHNYNVYTNTFFF